MKIEELDNHRAISKRYQININSDKSISPEHCKKGSITQRIPKISSANSSMNLEE
jgi:hypothetical protein